MAERGGGGGRLTPPALGSSWPGRRHGMRRLRRRRDRCRLLPRSCAWHEGGAGRGRDGGTRPWQSSHGSAGRSSAPKGGVM